MSTLGYKRREPPELDLHPETPTLLQEVFDFHVRQFGYGVKEFQKMLVANETDLMRNYRVQTASDEVRGRLRIVKQESVVGCMEIRD